MGGYKNKKLVIFGMGEIGSLARFYFDNDSCYQVVGFAADDEFVQSETFEGLPLVKCSALKDCFPESEFHMHVVLSYRELNKIRADKYAMVKSMGYVLASYVCSRSVTWPDLTIGDNCFILENQTIQPTVKIGNNVMIWSGNHIGHGSVIGDHVYISSHVVVAGHVNIGERAFLGINSTVKDFISIGPETFVTMGACVAKDTRKGDVVMDNSGVIYGAETRQAQMLKRKYFFI